MVFQMFIQSDSASVTAEEVCKAAMTTKGDSGPSVLETDGLQKILTSTSYGAIASNVCQVVAQFIKKLCTKNWI